MWNPSIYRFHRADYGTRVCMDFGVLRGSGTTPLCILRNDCIGTALHKLPPFGPSQWPCDMGEPSLLFPAQLRCSTRVKVRIPASDALTQWFLIGQIFLPQGIFGNWWVLLASSSQSQRFCWTSYSAQDRLSQQKIIRPQISLVSRLRNPALTGNLRFFPPKAQECHTE